MVGKRIDLSLFAPDSHKIHADSMQHSNVREIRAERMYYNAWKELRIDEVLLANGFTAGQAKLVQTQIISRAENPTSELATSKWIQENAAQAKN